MRLSTPLISNIFECLTILVETFIATTGITGAGSLPPAFTFNPISDETFIATLPVQIFFKAAFKIDFWQTSFAICSNFAIIDDTALYDMTEVQTEHWIYNFGKPSGVFTST